jgi:aspartyl-tRNA(Asn)/glutamyl-tRNA(Gln) amidotransferase subunit A
MTNPYRDVDAAAEARLAAAPGNVGASPAVLEDAQRQLSAMLAGLAELMEAFPSLGDPPAANRPAAIPSPRLNRANWIDQQPPTEPAAPANTTGERDLLALTISALAPLLQRREVSPVEVTRAALDRIAAHDGTLRTFITVTADQALDQAREAEREIAAGRYRGPLHGVPVAAKDLYETAGVPTTCGSPMLRDWIPAADAHAIAAWRQAGAILLGKNTLHEFAFGGTSVNVHTGTPRNPWNPAHMCGGSSGGSAAAVAAGFAYGALGSETGNSVRRPASFCGVVGLKPTFGRVSRRGIYPLAWSLDHAGVFARSAADTALLVAPLSGFDPADPGSRRAPAGEGDPAAALAPPADLRGRRAGIPAALLIDIEPEVQAAFNRALQALQARGVEVREVDLPFASRWTALVSSIVMHAEAAAVHARRLAERAPDYGPDVLARLLAGACLSTADYARAQTARGAVTAELLDVLREVDVLVAPGTPAPAPLLQPGAFVHGDAPFGTAPSAFHLQRLFSLTGLPAAAAPCGLDRAGLPLAVQVGGRPWDEATVLGFAQAVTEAANPPAVAPLPVEQERR